jgi:hypothetical protein
MVKFTFPGLIQPALECVIRSDGRPSTRPQTWDMILSFGAGSIVIDPCHMRTKDPVYHPSRFFWKLFTLRLDRPVNINNPWGL